VKVTLRRIEDGGNPVWQVRYWQGGRYVRKQFRDRGAAESHRELLEQESDSVRREELPPSEKLSLLSAHRRAIAGGYSLAQACDVYERTVGSSLKRIGLGEAICEFLAAKASKGLRPRSLGDLEVRLNRFKVKVGEAVQVSSIPTSRIESFMERGWEAQTRINWLVVLGNFFRWCVRRRYVLANPVSEIERPLLEPEQPRPLTVEQCSKILLDTCSMKPQLIPYVSISLFAGLRNSELSRLTWNDVDLNQGVIRVEAGKAKTRSRRVVTIQTNLKEWLAMGGRLPARATKAEWIKIRPEGYKVDQMRRTFCTYHLAAFGSAAKTALEAGHREAVLFRHYRGITDEAYALTFWDLSPKKVLGLLCGEASENSHEAPHQ